MLKLKRVCNQKLAEPPTAMQEAHSLEAGQSPKSEIEEIHQEMATETPEAVRVKELERQLQELRDCSDEVRKGAVFSIACLSLSPSLHTLYHLYKLKLERELGAAREGRASEKHTTDRCTGESRMMELQVGSQQSLIKEIEWKR